MTARVSVPAFSVSLSHHGDCMLLAFPWAFCMLSVLGFHLRRFNIMFGRKLFFNAQSTMTVISRTNIFYQSIINPYTIYLYVKTCTSSDKKKLGKTWVEQKQIKNVISNLNLSINDDLHIIKYTRKDTSSNKVLSLSLFAIRDRFAKTKQNKKRIVLKSLSLCNKVLSCLLFSLSHAHTHTHTYEHTHAHTHTHSYTHSHINTYTHLFTHTPLTHTHGGRG